MKTLRMRLYDAFASELHGGTVAGIVLCESEILNDRAMQRIAAELGAPTTGFVRAVSRGWSIRFFTPKREIDVCSHVTVGAFSSLVDDGLITCGFPVETFAFTKAGAIPIAITTGKERPIVEVQQRSPKFHDVSVKKSMLAECLGISLQQLHPRLPLQIVSMGLSHLIVPVAGASVLSWLNPNEEALATICEELQVDTIPVVAFKGLRTGVVARFRDLSSGIGKGEEAAFGTSNGALACYMAIHELSDELDRIGLAEQGREIGRASLIESELLFDEMGALVGAAVRGQAFRSLTGAIAIAPQELENVRQLSPWWVPLRESC